MTMHDRDNRSVDRDVQGDLVCTQCARVAGSVRGPNTGQWKTVTLRVPDPRHAEAVRHLRCPHCAGRLWVQNSSEVPIDPLAFDREMLRPRAGRPLKTPRPS